MSERSVFDAVLRDSAGYSMGNLWQALTVELSGEDLGFEDRADIFIRFLRELMQSGRLKLATNGIFLNGTVDEQLEVLRDAWPSSSVEDEDEMDFWFLAEAPAGVVWIAEDGTETWA